MNRINILEIQIPQFDRFRLNLVIWIAHVLVMTDESCITLKYYKTDGISK